MWKKLLILIVTATAIAVVVILRTLSDDNTPPKRSAEGVQGEVSSSTFSPIILPQVFYSFGISSSHLPFYSGSSSIFKPKVTVTIPEVVYKLSGEKLVWYEDNIWGCFAVTTEGKIFLCDWRGFYSNDKREPKMQGNPVQIAKVDGFLDFELCGSGFLYIDSSGSLSAWQVRISGDSTEYLQISELTKVRGVGKLVDIEVVNSQFMNGRGLKFIALNEKGDVITWSSFEYDNGALNAKNVQTHTLPFVAKDICVATRSFFALSKDGIIYETYFKTQSPLTENSPLFHASKKLPFPEKVKFLANKSPCLKMFFITEVGSLYCAYYPFSTLTSISLILRTKPVQVMTGKKFKYVATSSSYSVAITEDNQVYFWGENSKGEFGDGTTNKANVRPVFSENWTKALKK